MRLLQQDNFSPRTAGRRPRGPQLAPPAWTPEFDIVESREAFILAGDLPGLARKDVEVRLDEGVLTVRGERGGPDTAERWSRRERPNGRFERRLRIPDEVDLAGVRASLADGVLTLTLPKRAPGERSRMIEVG